MKPISLLVYGFGGGGKTTMGVSAGWDWKAKKPIRPFRWLRIGSEKNRALGVPDEYVRVFNSPDQKSLRFIDDLLAYLKALKIENDKAIRETGSPAVEAVIVDGISELGLLYESVHKTNDTGNNKFKVWDEMLEKLYALVQLLDPEELGAHVVVTARVGERRREMKDNSGKVINPGDPEYVGVDYYPQLRGSFRLSLPHYFDLVLYIEKELVTAEVGGKRRTNVPVHRLHLTGSKDYLLKSKWEYEWLQAGHPDFLDNASFDDLLNLIEGLEAPKGE